MSYILRLNLLEHKEGSTDGTYLWWGNQNPAPSRCGKSRKDKDVAFSFKRRANPMFNWSTARGQEPVKRRENEIMSVQKKKKEKMKP